jgi:SAM-dependent methyltransferase
MPVDPALVAYEAFAPVYNDFNHSNDYEMWLGRALLPELRKHGLPARGSALDVGCGTGRAFRPLLRRGWRIEGCDLSPAMLEIAAKEGGGAVRVHVADMRELPRFGTFDLVLSLNDCVNYLLGDRDVFDALHGMRANLAASGLLAFDVNTSATYATGYTGVREVEHLGSRWFWRGRGEIAPSVFEAEVEGDRLSDPIRQVARYRSEGEVVEAMRAVGIEPLAVLGMSEANGEVVLSAPPNEDRDYKMVFIGARAEPQSPDPVLSGTS